MKQQLYSFLNHCNLLVCAVALKSPNLEQDGVLRVNRQNCLYSRKVC